jgi:hypothetical protein
MRFREVVQNAEIKLQRKVLESLVSGLSF